MYKLKCKDCGKFSYSSYFFKAADPCVYCSGENVVLDLADEEKQDSEEEGKYGKH